MDEVGGIMRRSGVLLSLYQVLRDRRFHRKPMQDAFAALSTDLHRSAAVQAEITAFREGNHPMQRQRR